MTERKQHPILPIPDYEGDKLLTTAEVMKITGISRATLWAWRSRETNPFPAPLMFGYNTARYRSRDVSAWIEKHVQPNGLRTQQPRRSDGPSLA
jgi:predicted DNA-binding transcriptional regulator AlpA